LDEIFGHILAGRAAVDEESPFLHAELRAVGLIHRDNNGVKRFPELRWPLLDQNLRNFVFVD
jgi:hypothetical protein